MSDQEYWKDRWTKQNPQVPNDFARETWWFLKDKNVSTLLDVGCGDGKDSIFFHKNNLKVTALDFSESGVAKLRAKAPEITALQQEIPKIEFPDNSFDVIYAHLSLHYFDDATTTKIFENLYTILKPGGFLFVKCKSVDDPLYGTGGKVGEDMFYLGHVRHFFSKTYMEEKLKSFKLISIQETRGMYHDGTAAFIEAIATK